MLPIIPFRFAVNATLIILSFVIVFHLFVLAQVVPSDIVWGGRFKDADELRNFEILSIAINALIIFVLAIKGRYVNVKMPLKVVNGLIWLFFILFALNTVGNLFAKTSTETIIFTPLTFILAVLCLRVVLEKQTPKV